MLIFSTAGVYGFSPTPPLSVAPRFHPATTEHDDTSFIRISIMTCLAQRSFEIYVLDLWRCHLLCAFPAAFHFIFHPFRITPLLIRTLGPNTAACPGDLNT